MEHPFLMFIDHTQRRSTGQGRAARLLRSWVRIPPGAWIFVCCEWRVLSGRGLCDELITRPEESYRLLRRVCSRNIKNGCSIYIYDISRLRVNNLTLILLSTPPLCHQTHKNANKRSLPIQNGELLIMPANSRWDLIRGLKG